MLTTTPNNGRRGYTLVETVVVITILGLIAALLMPKLRSTFSGNARHSARREALSYIYRAQATAVQQSRKSWLIRSGNALTVYMDSAGVKQQLNAVLDVNKSFGATLLATPTDTIAFDPRGFAILSGTTQKYILTAGTSTAADTICVTGLSKIATTGCS